MPDDIPEPEITPTISINGVEYDPTEAQSLIDKGRQTSELEKQWNTSVDKVWPEYGKLTETVKTTAAERDALQQKIAQYEAKENAGTDTPQDRRAAQEAARQLGIPLNEDLEKTYIKKEDLEKYLETRDQQAEARNEILAKAGDLEKEIDGSDGRPSFNKKAVLAYAGAYKSPTLEAAYEEMHKAQLDKWKSEQVNSQKSKGLKTLGAGGAKEAREIKVTDDNVDALLTESLYGGS